MVKDLVRKLLVNEPLPRSAEFVYVNELVNNSNFPRMSKFRNHTFLKFRLFKKRNFFDMGMGDLLERGGWGGRWTIISDQVCFTSRLE